MEEGIEESAEIDTFFDMSDYYPHYTAGNYDLLDHVYDSILEFAKDKKLLIANSSYYHIKRPQLPARTIYSYSYPYSHSYSYSGIHAGLYPGQFTSLYAEEEKEEKDEKDKKYGEVNFDNNYSIKYVMNDSNESRCSLVASLYRYRIEHYDEDLGFIESKIFCNKDQLLEIIKKADYKFMDKKEKNVKKNNAKINNRMKHLMRKSKEEDLPSRYGYYGYYSGSNYHKSNYYHHTYSSGDYGSDYDDSIHYGSKNFSLQHLWKNINRHRGYHDYSDFDIYD